MELQSLRLQELDFWAFACVCVYQEFSALQTKDSHSPSWLLGCSLGSPADLEDVLMPRSVPRSSEAIGSNSGDGGDPIGMDKIKLYDRLDSRAHLI